MLKQRVITGAILAFVFISGILVLESRWISALFAVVLFAATRELLALTIRPPPLAAMIVAALFALIFWWSLSLVTPPFIYWQSLAGSAVWLAIAIGLVFYRYSGGWPLLVRVLMLGLGLDLLWICVHGLVFLHYAYGGLMLLFLFTLVWIADIGAYFGGRAFGKRKLAPTISPGKTWEGVAAGVVSNLLWVLLVYHAIDDPGLGLAPFMLIGMATVLISVVGDLFESILKREASVKDSGNLLPGHGGVLDRIDSLIAASPVFVGGLLLVDAA